MCHTKSIQNYISNKVECRDAANVDRAKMKSRGAIVGQLGAKIPRNADNQSGRGSSAMSTIV